MLKFDFEQDPIKEAMKLDPKQIVNLLFGDFVLIHEHKNLILNKRPDFSFAKKSNYNSLVYAPFLVELQINDFDNKHLGKVMGYNTEILKFNPKRQFIISVLTNMKQIKLIRTERSLKNPKEITNKQSEPQDFCTAFPILLHMLTYPETAGYIDDSGIKVQITER